MRPIQEGDIYGIYSRKAQKYGAVQVFAVLQNGVSVVTLDYIGESLPKDKRLKKLKPLYADRWFYDHHLDYRLVNSLQVPKSYIYLGNSKPVIQGKSNIYGLWPDEQAVESEAEWRAFPAKMTKPFKKAQKDSREITIGGVVCRRSFSGVGDAILAGIQDYSELDALPALARIHASQYYEGLIPYLQNKPFIRKLSLTAHCQKQLDFRGAYLHELELDVTGLERVFLNKSLQSLEISGEVSPLLEVCPDSDAEIDYVVNLKNNAVPDFAVPTVTGLALKEMSELDMEAISKYTKLTKLRLFGKPGIVQNIASMQSLSSLRRLYLQDIFGYCGEDFPAAAFFPELEALDIDSVPEEAGKRIRQTYKGVVPNLSVTKLRKPDWLAENLNNPFRGWDGSEFVPKGKAKRAAEIFKKARKEILDIVAQMQAEPGGREKFTGQLLAAAEEYGKAFNKLQGKTEFIETEEREDIFSALESVLADAKELLVESSIQFDEKVLYDAVDNVRDW